jgi:hypothetical protein
VVPIKSIDGVLRLICTSMKPVGPSLHFLPHECFHETLALLKNPWTRLFSKALQNGIGLEKKTLPLMSQIYFLWILPVSFLFCIWLSTTWHQSVYQVFWMSQSPSNPWEEQYLSIRGIYWYCLSLGPSPASWHLCQAGVGEKRFSTHCQVHL